MAAPTFELPHDSDSSHLRELVENYLREENEYVNQQVREATLSILEQHTVRLRTLESKLKLLVQNGAADVASIAVQDQSQSARQRTSTAPPSLAQPASSSPKFPAFAPPTFDPKRSGRFTEKPQRHRSLRKPLSTAGGSFLYTTSQLIAFRSLCFRE